MLFQLKFQFVGKTREVGLFEIKNLNKKKLKNSKILLFSKPKFNFVGKTREVIPKKRMLIIEHSRVKILTKEFGTNIG